MSTSESHKPREERLREFLQEVRQELDRVVQRRELFAAIVRGYVAKEIELLMQGRMVEARQKLDLAYRTLFQTEAQDDLEDFYEALCAFDFGFFAYSLRVYFDDVEWIARQIWQARREFIPILEEALATARFFVLSLSDGVKPRWALHYALKRPNHMSSIFGHSFLYGNKPAGEVLGESALAKLKKLLRAYVRKHCKGS